MLRIILSVFLVCTAAEVSQALELKTKPELIDQCLAEKKQEFHETCIGLISGDCMENNDGGDTTVGMGFCMDAERIYWDAKLNSTYKELVTIERKNDLEAKSEGWNAPEKLPPLKEMQRQWIGYRDALCEYERSQWGGGTGGGPAILSCLAGETARQALLLESYITGWGNR